MRTELLAVQIPIDAITSFGFLLCRTAGFFTFLPIPGIRSSLDLPRIALAALFAFLFTPLAPPAPVPSLSKLAVVAISEALLGLALGLAIGLIQEGLQLGAQFMGLQAGFSYASTIDPTSEADSAILQVLFTLAGALLFLTMGLDTLLFRLLLDGAVRIPPGAWTPTPGHAVAILALFPPMFTEAIRIALPVLAILLLVDIALALFSRMQPQLQLLSLSFPIKLLAAVVIVAVSAPLLPSSVERTAARSLGFVKAVMQP